MRQKVFFIIKKQCLSFVSIIDFGALLWLTAKAKRNPSQWQQLVPQLSFLYTSHVYLTCTIKLQYLIICTKAASLVEHCALHFLIVFYDHTCFDTGHKKIPPQTEVKTFLGEFLQVYLCFLSCPCSSNSKRKLYTSLQDGTFYHQAHLFILSKASKNVSKKFLFNKS